MCVIYITETHNFYIYIIGILCMYMYILCIYTHTCTHSIKYNSKPKAVQKYMKKKCSHP